MMFRALCLFLARFHFHTSTHGFACPSWLVTLNFTATADRRGHGVRAKESVAWQTHKRKSNALFCGAHFGDTTGRPSQTNSTVQGDEKPCHNLMSTTGLLMCPVYNESTTTNNTRALAPPSYKETSLQTAQNTRGDVSTIMSITSVIVAIHNFRDTDSHPLESVKSKGDSSRASQKEVAT